MLEGNRGLDTLTGGAGNDTLTGGFGADNFVFAGQSGSDRITDFAVNQDHLVIDVAGVNTFGNLTLSAWNAGLHVSWNGGSVLLEGVSRASFDAGDVIFV